MQAMMHVTDLAINSALGMRLAPAGSDHILELPESPSAPGSGGLLVNHLGTIHASVLFALAEAASGEFLLRQLGETQQEEQVLAVLRTSTVKYRKPASPGFGQLRASARFADTDAAKLSAELTTRSRALVAILVEIADAQPGGGVVTMTGQFDWFLQQPGEDKRD